MIYSSLFGMKFSSKSLNFSPTLPVPWEAVTLPGLHYRAAVLPARPETVALYLTAPADALKPSTLGRRLATISQVHQAAGHEVPIAAAPVRLV